MAKRQPLLMSWLTNCMIYMCLLVCMTAFHMAVGETQYHKQSALETAKHWKLFSYNFQPHAPVNDVNFYNPTNILATGIAIDDERIFIATPKLFSGVPSTVNYVLKADYGDAPVLQAYPDWSFSTTARTDFNCSDLVIVSVYRLRIDSCHRLWILDAGVSRSIEDYEITCPPKILIVDLRTNRVVRRVDFPSEILRGETLFTNLIVDETTSTSSTCDDAFVYISDSVEPAIIVYDSGRDVTWRLSHPAMYPDPDFAQAEILNERFVLMDGVVGITFDAKSGIVYFQPFATDRIFSVSKDALRAGPLAAHQLLDVKLVGKKSSQGIGMAISPIDRSLIFSPMTETAIASWNPLTYELNVLAYDQDRLQFVADITTSHDEDGFIYALSSKFHRFFLKNVNPDEINNRILRIKLPGLASIVPHQRGNYVYKPSVDVIESPPLVQYHPSNSLERKVFPGLTTVATTPKHSSTKIDFYRLTTKQPYNYEPVGLINYSVRNPFTALNQGESFPPRKELRNPPSYRQSFLDSLPASSIAEQPTKTRYHYGSPF